MPALRFRPATADEEAKIKSLLEMDYGELETTLGKRLGTLDDNKSPWEITRAWIAQKKNEIHKIICVEGKYCEFIKSNKSSRPIDIVASVADLLTATYGGLPVYQITCLLVRQGLDEYCGCD